MQEPGSDDVGAGDTVRVALVGYGLGGAVFHAPLIAATPGLELVSVVTSDPTRQQAVRERYPDVRVLPSVDDVWSAADEYDLVVISTANVAHVPLGMAAFGAGLPVVMDKPLAPTAADGERLARAARDRGLGFTVFQNRRWDSDFLTLRRLLGEGALGTPARFESRFERFRPERDAAAWRERAGVDDAGGLLFDLGSHLIDQAMLLFGRPTQVLAELFRRRSGAQVDDDTFVALVHPGEVSSHLWMSAVTPMLGPRFRVLGSAAAFRSFGLDGQEAALAAGGDPAAPDWWTEPEDRWGIVGTDDDHRPVPSERGDYPAFYAGVARALLTGSPMPVDPWDSVVGLRVIEAAARSAATGSVETISYEGIDA
ncbi:MAG TPA: Gfo/Idh/MocA family oxidoreductase [Actinomycetota bacterium]|jgi:predicted dehydrogenase